MWWRQSTPSAISSSSPTSTECTRSASRRSPSSARSTSPPSATTRVANELDEYFAGTRRTFTIHADLSYVDPDHFGRRVLETLAREVPWGETVTYGELADMVGSPRAARAVGNVMAHNPVQILLPCHRVVAADGIGGYGSSGVAMKRALLAIEGVHVP